MGDRAWRKCAAEVQIRVVRDLNTYGGRGFIEGFLDDGGQRADERTFVVDLEMGQPYDPEAFTGGIRTLTLVTRFSTGISCEERLGRYEGIGLSRPPLCSHERKPALEMRRSASARGPPG
jgi:hypothetical protein